MFIIRRVAQGGVSVEESSVARKRVWTYERPPRGTSAATRPLHAHRRDGTNSEDDAERDEGERTWYLIATSTDHLTTSSANP